MILNREIYTPVVVFFYAERKKLLQFAKPLVSTFFYRSCSGEEIDFIEEEQSDLLGYECKFSYSKEMIKKSQSAPVANVIAVTAQNFSEYLK